MGKTIDLTGKKFGRLLVLCRTARYSGKTGYKWLCLCECGRTRIVYRGHLSSKHTRSCGCLKIDLVSKLNVSHGLSRDTRFRVLVDITRRCYDEKHESYKDYGGRGIGVCDEWRNNPNNFISWAEENGYKKDLQIDRINNNGNYEPDNCRFVTGYVNTHNQRRLRTTNNSGYAGASPLKNGKYMARITSKLLDGGKMIYLGSFSTPEAAATARNNFIIKHNLPHRIQEIRE